MDESHRILPLACSGQAAQEALSHTAEEPFHLSAGGGVIGFGVDTTDPGEGTASGQKITGEARAVIDIKSLGDPIGREGFLEDQREGTDLALLAFSECISSPEFLHHCRRVAFVHECDILPLIRRD